MPEYGRLTIQEASAMYRRDYARRKAAQEAQKADLERDYAQYGRARRTAALARKNKAGRR